MKKRQEKKGVMNEGVRIRKPRPRKRMEEAAAMMTISSQINQEHY
jgi:hypothetical protein